MSFDRDALAAAVAAHGAVVRVVVAGVRGSAPREAGAAMLVWGDDAATGGQAGTIGGGALEWQAAEAARALLAQGGAARVLRLPLGPALGQCCGGAVVLVAERFEATTLPAPVHGVVARPVEGGGAGGGAMPLAVRRALAAARGEGRLPAPALVEGWMVEPAAHQARALWVWGAGHVGRALIATLAPLPDFALTWVDTDAARFPAAIPEGVAPVIAADPATLVAHAPEDAEHLIVTFSHALDLELCHRLLRHGFAFAGLIGSATKWARFRARLAALGHSPAAVDRITCPIGDPALGKHPQAIALGVGAALLRRPAQRARERAS